jgi:hypothetical protein
MPRMISSKMPMAKGEEDREEGPQLIGPSLNHVKPFSARTFVKYSWRQLATTASFFDAKVGRMHQKLVATRDNTFDHIG